MKSKKWTLLATSLTAMVLMAHVPSQQLHLIPRQLQIMQQQRQQMQIKLPILQKRTMILLMIKAQLLRLSYLAHQQTSLEMG